MSSKKVDVLARLFNTIISRANEDPYPILQNLYRKVKGNV